jgi:hypothetical protein
MFPIKTGCLTEEPWVVHPESEEPHPYLEGGPTAITRSSDYGYVLLARPKRVGDVFVNTIIGTDHYFRMLWYHNLPIGVELWEREEILRLRDGTYLFAGTALSPDDDEFIYMYWLDVAE